MTCNKPMNLLLIVSDEHSKRYIGCNGDAYAHTPAIDRIAKSGVNYTNAYCTCPICLPSRASFTTGDYPSKNSYWDNAFPYGGETPGFGHRLTEAGFPVTTIGKLHFRDEDPSTGFPDQRLPLNAKDGIGDVYSSLRTFEMVRPQLGEHVTKAHWGDSDYLRFDHGVADESVRFIREEAPNFDKPWLLKVGLVLPHFPFIAPEKWKGLFPPEKAPFPKKLQPGSASPASHTGRDATLYEHRRRVYRRTDTQCRGGLSRHVCRSG